MLKNNDKIMLNIIKKLLPKKKYHFLKHFSESIRDN